MKGQYFSIEQMFLFTIGVVLAAVIYFSLSYMEDDIKEMGEEDMAYEIGSLINAQMNRAYLMSHEGKIIFDIPKKISDRGYKVYVEGTGENLIVKIEDVKAIIPLNSYYNASGMLFSSAGKAEVLRKNKKIIIGRYNEP